MAKLKSADLASLVMKVALPLTIKKDKKDVQITTKPGTPVSETGMTVKTAQKYFDRGYIAFADETPVKAIDELSADEREALDQAKGKITELETVNKGLLEQVTQLTDDLKEATDLGSKAAEALDVANKRIADLEASAAAAADAKTDADGEPII